MMKNTPWLLLIRRSNLLHVIVGVVFLIISSPYADSACPPDAIQALVQKAQTARKASNAEMAQRVLTEADNFCGVDEAIAVWSNNKTTEGASEITEIVVGILAAVNEVTLQAKENPDLVLASHSMNIADKYAGYLSDLYLYADQIAPADAMGAKKIAGNSLRASQLINQSVNATSEMIKSLTDQSVQSEPLSGVSGQMVTVAAKNFKELETMQNNSRNFASDLDTMNNLRRALFQARIAGQNAVASTGGTDYRATLNLQPWDKPPTAPPLNDQEHIASPY
jgi:hypothetical protein